ncbi:MAG: M1 family metallopeptidase [Flavobacteriales bacterium]|jgi:aminopeptidase N|nr:M1 family metallopeptidase [Flavobacteriales bacterium]
MEPRYALHGLIAPLLFACSTGPAADKGNGKPAEAPAYVMDPHSHARPAEAVIKHLDLDIKVDLDSQRIAGVAAYHIERAGASEIYLDTDGLVVHGVNGNGGPLPFELGDSTLMGRPLRIALAPGTSRIEVRYSTGPGAKALQWLQPEQTTGRKHPFLFTQGQAILTRTWIPVQDSPGIRFTYKARVQVPPGLMAVMSATNPQERAGDGVYQFAMDQPIPAYLIALAVGDLDFEPLGERCGVYAEPGLLDKAAWEFADTERMLLAAESLYGPYRWGRYDVLVLPPSFPFGGMENPMLTFATPTIIAGDRSLNALIAHELAHSWSGNLVTNATWNDFWLNEGFTVYFENRISEALYGRDYAGMLAQLGRQDLDSTLARILRSGRPADTHLRLDLAGRDPDEGMTDVAYEKGAAFLRMLEAKVGRAKFDAFLRDYFERFAFTSMTTDMFLAHLKAHLLEPDSVEVDLAAWVDGPGLPPDAPTPESPLFAQVEAELERWHKGAPADQLATAGWSTFEWLHFIRHLPRPLTKARMTAMDNAFAFTQSGNAEILAAWLEQCIRNSYAPAEEKLAEFLTTVGRRKFLTPLYTELVRTEKGRIMAQEIYRQARPNYHSVARNTMDELLAWKDNKPPVDF